MYIFVLVYVDIFIYFLFLYAHVTLFTLTQKKTGFAERSKILAEYRSER